MSHVLTHFFVVVFLIPSHIYMYLDTNITHILATFVLFLSPNPHYILTHCHFVALQLFHFSFVSSSGLCCISLCQHYLIHMKNLMNGFPRTLRATPKTNPLLMRVSTVMNFILLNQCRNHVLVCFLLCEEIFLCT